MLGRGVRGEGKPSPRRRSRDEVHLKVSPDFGSNLGPPLGPVWAHFGHHFFDVFLKWLFDGLGLHLGSQNTSKMRPKRVPKTHLIKK